MEYFRLDDSGRLNDTQERLTSRGFGYGGDDDNPVLRRHSNRGSGAPTAPPGFGFSRGHPSGPFYNERRRADATARQGPSSDRRAADTALTARPTVTGF